MNNETSAAEVVDGHLVPATEQPAQLARPMGDNPLFAMVEAIERLATNPEVTPDKINMILDAQERILDRQAKMAYTAAMSQFREKCPQIVQDQVVGYTTKKATVGYTHASLAGAMAQIKCLMAQCGLSHSWRYDQTQPGLLVVSCIVTHAEGHSEQTSLSLPHDTSGSKNAIQAIGSTSSYGERYTLFAMLGLASAPDDDGAAGAPGAPEPLAKARKAQKARQAPSEPDPGTPPEPDDTGPPEPDPGPPPQQTGGGITLDELAARKKFAQVCNTLAQATQALAEGESFTGEQFRALLGQAKALAGTNDLAEATTYVMSDARCIVNDSSGVRIIPNA